MTEEAKRYNIFIMLNGEMHKLSTEEEITSTEDAELIAEELSRYESCFVTLEDKSILSIPSAKMKDVYFLIKPSLF